MTGRIFGIVLAVMLLCFPAGQAGATGDQDLQSQAAALMKRAEETDPKLAALLKEYDLVALLKEYDEEVLWRRAVMLKRAEEVKPELRAMLKELEAMKDTKEFREFGFSTRNPAAIDWETRVKETRARLEAEFQADGVLPPEVATVPRALLLLGVYSTSDTEQARDMVEWELEAIQNGLNWKLPDD